MFGVYATPLEEPWDGAIHAALTAVAEDGEITYDHVDDLGTADEMERALRDIIASENPDVIVGDAFAAEDAVREVAKEFPDTAFVFGSGGKEQAPNFSVFDNWLQDPAYLAGMLAGGLTKTGTIGVVGAMPIPEVNRIVNAFTAGCAGDASRTPRSPSPSSTPSSTRRRPSRPPRPRSPAAPTCCSPSATA